MEFETLDTAHRDLPYADPGGGYSRRGAAGGG